MTRLIFLSMLAACTAWGAENDGSISLFNGRDLSGWTNVNCAPETWTVKEGVIHCTGKPIGALRTLRQYENFVLELDWRHLSTGGNSGVFIWASPIAAPGVPFLRAIEVQVLDNGYNVSGKGIWFTTHGDVFPIHGSTMAPFGRHNGMRSFPSEEHSKSSPEWNHYRVACSNGVLRLSVNGTEVSGGENCNYRKGYIGLESEGGPVEFRNIRLKELPGSGALVEVTAPEDPGWRSLFTGVDLRGWRTPDGSTNGWRVKGEMLTSPGSIAGPENALWTEQGLGPAEFIIDCRPSKRADNQQAATPVIYLGDARQSALALPIPGAEAGKYRRCIITLKGAEVMLSIDGKPPQAFTLSGERTKRVRVGLGSKDGAAEFMNLYVRDL